MKAKRMLSLVMAAVLALCVLAGCRGGRALSQVMAGLLEGQYQNVAVEADPDLETALRAAVREGGELADILARLKQELGLGGGTLALRGLSGGRRGEHAVELRFEPGSDPDTAARKAFADWDAALARLPSDGQYAAAIAMVEAKGGYYIAVDVKIVKAGKPDTDDDEGPKDPYTEDEKGNYTVNTPEGLMALFEDNSESDFADKTITLQAGRTYTVNKPLAETFKGTLKSSGNGEKATIKITGENLSQGLFETIESGGTVQNLNINVTGSISGSASAGTYAYAGAVAGENRGIVSGCTVTASGKISASITGSGTVSGLVYAGGVAGYNASGCKIENCKVTASGKISASITGSGSGAVSGQAYAGGVAGYSSCTLNDSGKLNGSGQIKATVGTNIATVTEGDEDGIEAAGYAAYAGRTCGYPQTPAA